jgi:hypothetical protein
MTIKLTAKCHSQWGRGLWLVHNVPVASEVDIYKTWRHHVFVSTKLDDLVATSDVIEQLSALFGKLAFPTFIVIFLSHLELRTRC